MKTSKFDVLVLVMVVLTVLVAPTQWALKIQAGPEHTVADVGLAPADVMMALTAIVWGVGVLARRQLRKLTWPPLAAWVFLALCVPSLAWTGSLKRGAVELIQYVEYFLVAYLVFSNTLVSRRARQAVLAVLAVGLFVNVAFAYRMYATTLNSDNIPADIAGLLGNRNVFGAYLCLLVPTAGAFVFFTRTLWVRIIGAILVLAPLGFMIAGGPFLGLLIGLGVLVALWNFRFLPVYLALALALVLFVFPAMRHDNLKLLTESIFLYDEAIKPDNYPLQQRYVEWQQVIKSLDPTQPPYLTRSDYLQRVLLGHGIGLYEKDIERFLGALPKADADRMETDAQNQYLVLAVSSGFPAALAFIWLLATFAHRARLSMLTSPDPTDKALAAGLLVGIIALAVAANFALVLVRGVGLVLVCLAAMTTARKTPTA